MMSPWYLIPMITIVFASGYAASLMVRKGLEDIAYARGIKKGHEDMQGRMAEVVKRCKGSKIHGTCNDCGKSGQVCMSPGPLLCNDCSMKNKK